MKFNQKYFYFILLLWLVSGCAFERAQKIVDPIQKYKVALDYYEREKYYKAGVLIEQVIPEIRGRAEYMDAQYYYAYCQYYQDQLALAAYYFEKFYQSYGRSELAENALYMQGISLYEASEPHNLDQTNTREAIVAVQNFLNVYPNTTKKEDSEKILFELQEVLERKAFEQAKLYYKLRRYEAAIIAFDNFQEDFPDSDYQEEAAYLKIETQYSYAKFSISNKQEERFADAITFYEFLIDNYPDSPFLKKASNIYDDCLEELSKLKDRT